MKQRVTVVCHHEHGAPERVVRVERWPIADIKPNEVLVLMKAAPISPADLNMLEGRYAELPVLPAVMGNEGVGVVAQRGIAVAEFREGQHVIRPGHIGSWCEAYTAPAKELVAVPPGIALEQAAMLTSIIPAAWRMLSDFGPLNRGDWVVQNAANSAVGRAVIQLARQRGLRTINIVRRAALKPELERLGADIVMAEGELAGAQVGGLPGGAPVRLGLNAVSGSAVEALAHLVGSPGTVVTYGAMSRQPMQVANAQLIFRDVAFRGFWMTGWYRRVSEKEVSRMFAEIFPLVRSGKVVLPVEQTYPLEEAVAAVKHAENEGRSGKILFTMN